jgi:hypothetical protein
LFDSSLEFRGNSIAYKENNVYIKIKSGPVFIKRTGKFKITFFSNIKIKEIFLIGKNSDTARLIWSSQEIIKK